MKQHYTYLIVALSCCINITAKAQVNKQDSFALVDLYNSTNGPKWFNKFNWLKSPVKDWYGIGLSNNGKRVAYIDLRANKLTGFIPSSIGHLSHLSYLYLSNNKLNGDIPPELGKLSSLSFLWLDGNQLSGNIPPELGNLSNLTDLLLNDNQLSGNIPPELGKLSNLYYLYLHNNKLSGNIPPELGKLSNLYKLYLHNNKLSESIPQELGNLSNLSSLYLHSNQLSGHIPPDLGNLKNLQELYLSNNQLTGYIPSELSNLSNLHGLGLTNNLLSGRIPLQIGNLHYLEWLILSNNNLEGTIPKSIVYMYSLVGLYLDHNKLRGKIPALPPGIYGLNLSYNRFTFDGMQVVAKFFPDAKYNRQAIIPLHLNKNTFSVSAGGTLDYNTYKWFKKGQPGYVTIKGDSAFHPTESGIYFVKVSNKIATQLNLVSDTIYYTAPASLSAVAANKQPKAINNSFSVYPNPAKNILHVTTKGNASFSLINEDGKILLTTNIYKTGVIDISNIIAGSYYLKNNNTNISKKIAIIK